MGEDREWQPQPWVCPKCNTERPAGHKFCVRCGVDSLGNGPVAVDKERELPSVLTPITRESILAAAKELGIDAERLKETIMRFRKPATDGDNVVFGKRPTAKEIEAARERAKKGK